MTWVGKSDEFMPWQHSQPSGSDAGQYIYRRSSRLDNPPGKDVFGLLLTGLPALQTASSCWIYRSDSTLQTLITQCVQAEPDHVVDTDHNTVRHEFWRIKHPDTLATLQDRLEQIEAFYPLDSWQADGDVRAQSSALLLADNQLLPLPCHRLLADLAGLDDHDFLQRLQKCFNIRVASGADDALPRGAREFGLYVAGYWYHLRLIDGTWFHADPVSDLDVSIIHDNMLVPLLGVTGHQDSRVASTGADCDVCALQQQVDSGQWQALWLMPAPDIDTLMTISDLGRPLPAHTVCFRPVFQAAVLDVITG